MGFDQISININKQFNIYFGGSLMCLQMQSTLNCIIDNDKPIIFNKCIINANPNIDYNYNTGHFTINSNGI